jgi:hypothetical protein
MVWWRRNNGLWHKSLLHRYALRDGDAVLRSRGFAKSQSRPAQHNDNGEGERPKGLSDLEWIQLQHYRRWKRKIAEDPYHAIFGASNDMLNGRGLKDWSWIHKVFPKWMVNEMGMENWQKHQAERKQGKYVVNTRKRGRL